MCFSSSRHFPDHSYRFFSLYSMQLLLLLLVLFNFTFLPLHPFPFGHFPTSPTPSTQLTSKCFQRNRSERNQAVCKQFMSATPNKLKIFMKYVSVCVVLCSRNGLSSYFLDNVFGSLNRNVLLVVFFCLLCGAMHFSYSIPYKKTQQQPAAAAVEQCVLCVCVWPAIAYIPSHLYLSEWTNFALRNWKPFFCLQITLVRLYEPSTRTHTHTKHSFFLNTAPLFSVFWCLFVTIFYGPRQNENENERNRE